MDVVSTHIPKDLPTDVGVQRNMIKIIILIISSANEPVYQEMKRLSHIYYQHSKDVLNLDIQYFYMEFREEQSDEVMEEEHTLYVKGATESVIPGLYEKTMKSLQYVQSKYEYDFVLRTNLSSFVNVRNVLSYVNTKPRHGFFGGYLVSSFISGTCILFSRDIGHRLTSDLHYHDMTHDDVLMSSIVRKHGISLDGDFIDGQQPHYMQQFQNDGRHHYHVMYLIDGGFCPEKIETLSDHEVNNIIFYRVKHPNRVDDVRYFHVLLLRVYGIKM